MLDWLRNLIRNCITNQIKREFKIIIENQAMLEADSKAIISRLEDLELDFSTSKARVYKQFRKYASFKSNDERAEENKTGFEIPEEINLIAKSLGIDTEKALTGDPSEIAKIKSALNLNSVENEEKAKVW
tara:strand:+ start:61 stop:450 length:390 start_codon:yes stop_codon:yes gene_type:complete